jgi:hypothetical protein
MKNQTLGIIALVFALGLVAIAPTMSSLEVYAEDRDNDNGKGNNDRDNGRGNDDNGNSDKKDSPSDDDSGGGNDPPNN